jgi:RNA polymerase sigma factor (sigma-70 family)
MLQSAALTNEIGGANKDYCEIAKPASEAELVTRYRTPIIGMLTRLTRDPDRAEDLAQDTLLVVLKKLRNDGIRQPDKLTAYVYSTARFLYFGWLRKKDNQVELREDLAETMVYEEQIELELIKQEELDILREGIFSLNTERDRDVLLRCYFQHQTKPEICDALSLNPEHYDRVISRARNRLRHCNLTIE